MNYETIIAGNKLYKLLIYKTKIVVIWFLFGVDRKSSKSAWKII